MIRLRSLRGRLLVAFVLVAVPPLLVLAVAVSALLARSFEASSRERLESALRSAVASGVPGQTRQGEGDTREVLDDAVVQVPGHPAPFGVRRVRSHDQQPLAVGCCRVSTAGDHPHEGGGEQQEE